MKTKTIGRLRLIFSILMIISLTIFIPQFSNMDNFNVDLTNEGNSKIINVRTPQLRFNIISSNPDFFLLANISKLNLDNNNSISIDANLNIEDGMLFDIDDPGYYLFVFITDRLITLDIDFVGIYDYQLISFFVIFIINIMLYFLDRSIIDV